MNIRILSSTVLITLFCTLPTTNCKPKRILIGNHGSAIRALDVSADGSKLAVGAHGRLCRDIHKTLVSESGTMSLWKLNDEEPHFMQVFPEVHDSTDTLRFFGDQTKLISGGTYYSLLVHDIATHTSQKLVESCPQVDAKLTKTSTVLQKLSPLGSIQSIACNKHNQVAVLHRCSQNQMTLWGCNETGRLTEQTTIVPSYDFQHDGRDVWLSPDGTMLLISHFHGILVYEREIDEIPFHLTDIIIYKEGNSYHFILSIDCSPDKSTIICGTSQNGVLLYHRTDDSEKFTLREAFTGAHSDMINSVYFNSDGTSFASASEDHTVLLWQPSETTYRPSCVAREEHRPHVVTFTPNNHTLIVGFDGGDIIEYDLTYDE